MNKFIKHKLSFIDGLEKQLIIRGTQFAPPQKESCNYNNRQLNYLLKLLRSLPEELLISNNPDIAQALAEAAHHCNLDALAKTNINQKCGRLSSVYAKSSNNWQEELDKTMADLSDSINEIAKVEPTTATQVMDAYLQKRKEHKRQYIALSHKAKELSVARLKELAKVNPKLQKQLRALMCLRGEITIIFTESDGRPVTAFFNEWVRLIHQQ